MTPTTAGKLRREYHHREPVRLRNGNYSRLTPDLVRTMRDQHERVGLCISCIALLHSVPYTTAWEAINYATWRNVT